MYYWSLLQGVFVDYLITTCMAYGLYLMFEAPSNNIMSIFEGEELYRVLCGDKSDDMKHIKDSPSNLGYKSNNVNEERTSGEIFDHNNIQIEIQTGPDMYRHLQVEQDDDGSVSVASSSKN